MSDFDFILFSDGGGERGSTGAGGCLIEEGATGKRLFLAVFLGAATNNESEITAALLGFSFLHLFAAQYAGKKQISVKWVCDSEYVLKSGTGYIINWQKNGWQTAQKKPVKNQGLWKTFLSLTEALQITPEHVRGHTGHPENEACDAVSTWVRANGEDMLDEQGNGALIDAGDEPWMLIDGREFLKGVRNDSPGEDDMSFLVDSLETIGISDFSMGGGSKKNGLKVVLKKIESAKSFAEGLIDEDEQVREVIASLDEILGRFNGS